MAETTVMRELRWTLVGTLCACGGGRTPLDGRPRPAHPTADAGR